jgi:phosphoglycolate phosphatase
MRLRAAAFDLDGTLIDSDASLAASINGLREQLGLPSVDGGAVARAVGWGLPHLLQTTISEWNGPLRELIDRYSAFYERNLSVMTTPYPGALEGVARARDAGLRTALVTNKGERFTRMILEHFGANHLFDLVVGGDSLPARKPDGMPLRHVALRLEILERAERVYVGDSIVDAEAAANADWQFGLVATGKLGRGDGALAKAPDFVADSVNAMVARLLRHDGGGT